MENLPSGGSHSQQSNNIHQIAGESKMKSQPSKRTNKNEKQISNNSINFLFTDSTCWTNDWTSAYLLANFYIF